MIWYIDIMRFQVLTDDQTKLVFEVKKDDLGKSFLAELNRAIQGKCWVLIASLLLFSFRTWVVTCGF